MKRTHKEIRKSILENLEDGKSYSYGYLERVVNSNWITIRYHIEDLILFEMVEVIKNKVSLTNKGKELLKRL